MRIYQLLLLSIALPLFSQTFVIGPESQRGRNGFMVFRDQSEQLWPVYMTAHAGERVEMELTPAGVPTRGFSITSTNISQSGGNQSRRILGELIDGEGNPSVTFTVKEIAPTPLASESKKKKKSVRNAFRGTLSVGGRTVPVQGTLSTSSPRKSDGVNAVIFWADFEVRGKDIGLKTHANRVITCRFGANAATPRTKKK